MKPVLAGLGLLLCLSAGCGASAPMPTVAHVDLARFAGDWFVVAHLPMRAERNAYDAVEHYDIDDDGRIRVRFTYREGAFDGEAKTMRLRAWVHDTETNAEWRVRPFWPLALDYLVIWLDPDYRVTVIGHPSRDYVWIMARDTRIDDATMATIRERLVALGYDLTNLRMVPQSVR